MVYSKEQEAENSRQIHLLAAELSKLININSVLKGADEGRFGMAFETGTNRLEIWGLGNNVRLEIE